MGASSGLIVAFVVAVWAAYFVPLVLRRYDEAGKTAALETSGESGRVISPEKQGEPLDKSPDKSPSSESQPEAKPAPISTLDRPSARLAAQRRRRTLLTLIAAFAITAGVAIAGLIPLWSVAFPVALIVAWLVACRIQVRGELGISASATPTVKEVGKSIKTIENEDTIVLSGQIEDLDPARPHVMESTPLTGDALDDQVVIAVPSVSTHGDAMWDPLPITVPTYVTKPRAGRTIRTIDFNQPGMWTSGHVEGENTELPKRRDEDDSLEDRRAVGG